MDLEISFAPHVGTYVAATDAEDGALLAIVLSAGSRGSHRVLVLDTASWAPVASFPAPNDAKSGVTPIGADGEVLIVNDDHRLVAFRARTGERLWERVVAAGDHVRLLDAGGGVVMVSFVEGGRASSRLLSTRDGSDVRTLPFTVLAGLEGAALGRDGTIVWGGMRSIGVLHIGDGASKEWPIPDAHFGAAGPLAVSPDGARVAFATRHNAIAVMDLTTGACTAAIPAGVTVRSTGFVRGVPWVLDRDGKLSSAEGGPALATGIETYGGIVSSDGARLSLGDLRTRTFRVRRTSDGAELFATTPGFSCDAVCVDAEGGLLVASDEKLVRIDPASGKAQKLASGASDLVQLASGASDLVQLANGSVALLGGSLRLLPAGERKPLPLARRIEDASVAAGLAFSWCELAIEVWDLETRTRTFHADLAKTWLAETGEAVRFLHAGPDGRPWVHMTDGAVYRADALERDDALVGRLPKEGALWLHPDGRTLYRAHDGRITPIAIEGFVEGAPLPSALDAHPTKLVFSPSGARLAVLHRDGRASVIELAARTAVPVASPATSAAARAPNEVFVLDLATPHGCAFGPHETTLLFSHAGGVAIASATTGAVLGQLLVATNGKDWVATDGNSVDWPAAKPKTPVSSELTVLDGGAPLSHTALVSRRTPGLLAALMGGSAAGR